MSGNTGQDDGNAASEELKVTETKPKTAADPIVKDCQNTANADVDAEAAEHLNRLKNLLQSYEMLQGMIRTALNERDEEEAEGEKGKGTNGEVFKGSEGAEVQS